MRMAELVLFHNALGLTEGMRAFADRLRSAGHHVALPDLFHGATFGTVEEGVAHAEAIGFDEIVSRGEAAVAELPAQLVYGGFSLGAMPAQKLAQNRPGARALLLYEGGVPLSAYGGAWPDGVVLQIHAKEEDDWSEVDVLQELARAVPAAELHLYPGANHLFTDASFDAYDERATDMVAERTLDMLRRLG
jgi:dienelactone hydrolase